MQNEITKNPTESPEGHSDRSPKQSDEITSAIVVNLVTVGIILGIIWFIFTILQWLFLINIDACHMGAYDCVYGHPIRYTIPEILGMQWEWIIAHRLF